MTDCARVDEQFSLPRSNPRRSPQPQVSSLQARAVRQAQPRHLTTKDTKVTKEDELIIELKSVDKLKGIHQAQLLTYMKLAGVKTGLLLNFNVGKLKSGIKRLVL